MKFTHVIFATWVAVASARAQLGTHSGDGITWTVAPLGIPCDPAIEREHCLMPVDQQGVMIYITGAGDHTGYRVTVHYADAQGAKQKLTRMFDRTAPVTVEPFRIGRIAVAHLSGGNVVERVEVQKVWAGPPIITPGPTTFGPPPGV